MQVHSHAKINWALRIIGKRSDGYHDLETLFQTISLYDVLTFGKAERTQLTCDDPTIPTDASNLILRAATALGAPPVAIHLQKRIPAGGGLGGGSSNAAMTLVTLNSMFDLGFSPHELHEIALSLGSDVPFFLVGGTAYATGRGEELASMPSAPSLPLLLVLPRERVRTPDAFRILRRFSNPIGYERFRDLLAEGLLAHAGYLINDFEEPVFQKLPALATLKRRLVDAGAAWASMSGSGSTIVAAFRDPVARDAARSTFRDVRTESAEPIAASSAFWK